MDINTCTVLTVDVHSLAYYTHLFPIVASLLLAGYLFVRTKHNLLSRVFFYFTIGFVFWLICDLVAWTVPDYYLITFFWALFDYVNVLFFLYGFYFLLLIARQRDIPLAWKWIGLLVTLPAFYVVVTGQSVVLFDQATCEAWGSDHLNTYKNIVEILVVVGIFSTLLVVLFSSKFKSVRPQVSAVGISLLLFFLTFTVTDYLSVATSIYEIGLYGLVVMPIFLGLIVYSIVTFQTFRANIVGAQLLVVSLLALIVSELLFVESLINQVLIGITLLVASLFGVALVRSVKREIEHREEIERLAKTLDETNGRQETLIHFIGHEVKGFLTKDSGAFASLLDGDFAPLPEAVKSFVTQALLESRNGADSVANILKASNLKKGTVTYAKDPFDLKDLVAKAVEKAKLGAEQKGLTLTFAADEGSYQMLGDAPQLSDHVLRNLIDNAVNYTPTGTIAVTLKKVSEKLVFAVKDSGVGITAEDKKHLFTEGGHGAESQKINVHSTGYGLYIAKQITEAHQGTIRAESEGAGKGSTFIAEFPAAADRSSAASAGATKDTSANAKVKVIGG